MDAYLREGQQSVWCSICYGDHYSNNCPKKSAAAPALPAVATQRCLHCNERPEDHQSNDPRFCPREGRKAFSGQWRTTSYEAVEQRGETPRYWQAGDSPETAPKELFSKPLQEEQPLPAPPDDKDAIIGQLRKELGECYILSGADPDKDADEPWRLAPYAVREVKRLREESDEEMEQLQKELDLHKRALTHEQTMCNEQAETIRQMTELVREYRNDHLVREVDSCFRWSSADTRCSLCIKADLLLKEPE